MIVGVRQRSKITLIKQHLLEADEQIDGWTSERCLAKKRNDTKYYKHCDSMIIIWTNTKNKLEQELKEYSI